MSDDVPSGIDFRVPADVAKWLETAEQRPGRQETRDAIAGCVRRHGARRILELGPGPGWLAETILATCAVDEYVLFDFSQTFLDMCRERLGDRATCVLGDFKRDDWPRAVGTFDAVVTMQAVHELRHKRYAAALYHQIREVLEPGGLLVVCDHEPKDDARTIALHASEAEQHAAMRAAGFVPETVARIERRYVITGVAPRSRSDDPPPSRG